MIFLAWALFILFTIVGILGSLLPGIPGLPLVVAGSLIRKWILPEILSWWGIAALGTLALLSFVIEFVTTVWGAKRWGRATKAGIFGAGLGGIVGIMFGPLGLLLGPIVGAMLGELSQMRTLLEAARSGIGSGLGMGASVIARLGLAALALAIVAIDLFV